MTYVAVNKEFEIIGLVVSTDMDNAYERALKADERTATVRRLHADENIVELAESDHLWKVID